MQANILGAEHIFIDGSCGRTPLSAGRARETRDFKLDGEGEKRTLESAGASSGSDLKHHTAAEIQVAAGVPAQGSRAVKIPRCVNS